MSSVFSNVFLPKRAHSRAALLSSVAIALVIGVGNGDVLAKPYHVPSANSPFSRPFPSYPHRGDYRLGNTESEQFYNYRVVGNDAEWNDCYLDVDKDWLDIEREARCTFYIGPTPYQTWFSQWLFDDEFLWFYNRGWFAQ